MSAGDPRLDPELESLLEFRKATRHIPDEVRARVLARSRAFLSGGQTVAPLSPFQGMTTTPAAVSRGRVLGRVAVVASIAIATGAVAALHGRPFDAPSLASPTRLVAPSAPVFDETMRNSPPENPPTSSQRPPITRHRPTRTNPLAEVELLQRTHLAYARRDFSSALALIDEHARRFPRGPLAEEREALRVESLIGSDRDEEARRAGAAFAARFPRSVLLPRIDASSHDPK